MKKLGMKGSPTGKIFFQDARVPVENLVQGENQALGILLGGLDVERAVGASMGVGRARAALDRALKYAQERVQFGQPLIMFKAVSERLANMATNIEAGKLLTFKAATMYDTGVRAQANAYAKLFASEICVQATSDAVQILGGYGYMQEYDVERMFRDARLGPIGAGSSEVMRLILTKELVKQGTP